MIASKGELDTLTKEMLTSLAEDGPAGMMRQSNPLPGDPRPPLELHELVAELDDWSVTPVVPPQDLQLVDLEFDATPLEFDWGTILLGIVSIPESGGDNDLSLEFYVYLSDGRLRYCISRVFG